jgi:pilus assembly protein CpaB
VSFVLFLAATQRADVVVMSRDIDVPRPLTRDDVEIRTVSAELAPPDVAQRVDDVIGLTPRAPLVRGQLVLTRAVAPELAGFRTGLTLSPGLRAVAIPVSAVSAVGGAIVPGARVDILAVPVLGRAPAGRTAELLASAVTVLDVRDESGIAYIPREAKTNAATLNERIASVVIAIPAGDEVRFADRIATSTFVLTLVGSR